MLFKKWLWLSLFTPFLAHAAPVTLLLTNGDSLQGDLLERSQQSVTIKHQLLGEMVIQTETIAEIRTQYEALTIVTPEPTEQGEAALPEAVIAEEAIVVEPDDTGLLGTGWLTDWERRLDVGVSGSAGKTSNQLINLGFTADLATEETRIASRTAYFRSKSEGDLSDNAFFTSINRDWLIPESQWFRFAGARLDADQFKDWNQRVNANAGVGYEFANSDDFLLLGRSGIGFSQTIGGEREEFTPEGLVGIESRWRINDAQRLSLANTIFPSFDNMGEYRNLTTFDWILDLDSLHGVAFKAGVVNEYDSATEDGISKNDFKYTLSLSWSL